ncbi:MurR/RpiR family transcriptional regulator [Paenibacillus xerothermodurans]|uniref:MurR/RpiR family transcriptional regulator n=1 Tax=Paenibacillus xerothermodurans TaxID=1977292 RepID=A0A2W1P6V2_PAEXE|nr:MurR/RpiR family transcriptional regulator [Paenibacillus xerothermodurans]PZE22788.1 MurR/RpiR family transcriptional regulator [Paenibacillus xerothermodurans]
MEQHLNSIGRPGYLTRIDSVYAQLSQSEKKVADYVSSGAEEIIHLSIAELAERSGSSDSSIIRFCRRLGYKGYQDLKINVAKDVMRPEKQIQEGIELNDSVTAIKQKIYESSVQALHDTLEVLQDDQLEKAIDAIAAARMIEIYGTGASGSVAFDAQHKFLKIGIKTLAYTDVFMQAMSASLLNEQDVLIAISHSGTNLDIIHAAETAREQGATVICITNFSKSPITKVAHITLFTAAPETMFRTDAVASRIAQLMIIDAIYTAVALKHPQRASDSLFKTRNSTTHKRH